MMKIEMIFTFHIFIFSGETKNCDELCEVLVRPLNYNINWKHKN